MSSAVVTLSSAVTIGAAAAVASLLAVMALDAIGDLSQAAFGYNHSQAYVNDVLARARG